MAAEVFKRARTMDIFMDEVYCKLPFKKFCIFKETDRVIVIKTRCGRPKKMFTLNLRLNNPDGYNRQACKKFVKAVTKQLKN